MTYPTSMTELTDSVPSSGAAATTTLGNATYQHATWHRSAAAEIEAISSDLITTRGSYSTMAARMAKAPISLFNLYANISTTHTDGTFDDLQSVTIAAGQLASNGDRILARWAGVPVLHATATRQVRAVFGGTTVADTTAYATTAGGVYVWDLEIVRVSSSVVRVSLNGNNPAYTAFSFLPFAGGAYTEVTGLTLANTQVLKITAAATGAGAASGDITGRSLNVTYFPAP